MSEVADGAGVDGSAGTADSAGIAGAAGEGAVPAWCEHGPGAHDGGVLGPASAPVAARAWLLIEHPGPWGHSAVETDLPAPLADLAAEADALGIRVQLIRRPRPAADAPLPAAGPSGPGEPVVYAAWTGEPRAWGARIGGPVPREKGVDLAALAAGSVPAGATADAVPLYLVCAHARRDRCCGRFGGALARVLAVRYPGRVWETTHLGGHKHAANLALLPHGLYYGPADLPAATEAIEAYERGEVVARRYRGQAGRNPGQQQAAHARLLAGGGRGSL
ncbi:MAG TPA: sucrase ferredoxin [Trebonia sp.]|nr:sucrase ferredoxin [Trebonia sp.]